jgi:precorrin-6x reductase
MFLFTWLFDKLGYMPKVTVDTTWPFPIEVTSLSEVPNETTVKAIKLSRKAVAKKTARKPKVK